MQKHRNIVKNIEIYSRSQWWNKRETFWPGRNEDKTWPKQISNSQPILHRPPPASCQSSQKPRLLKALNATLGTLLSNCQLSNIKGNFALHSVFRVLVRPRRNTSCCKPKICNSDNTSSHSSRQQEDKSTAEKAGNSTLGEKMVMWTMLNTSWESKEESKK